MMDDMKMMTKDELMAMDKEKLVEMIMMMHSKMGGKCEGGKCEGKGGECKGKM